MSAAESSLRVDEATLALLRFGADGLIPAVITDPNGHVLMVAYMDEVALRRTLEDGRTWFYSRSRQEYWAKGETSGNRQIVRSITTDCDSDTLLISVDQIGEGACHTGAYSCFFREVATNETGGSVDVD
ncbi:MAG: phosphoribosyl-AMP cyclohydrolase [Acidimicrobiales bacterium]